jgi:transcriptional regulator with XRE-family HTH domain
VVAVDNRSEVREFLASRRARITPAQAGLPAYGGNRRVSGLRREEVALLAGVSVDYYTRLERGSLGGASESVLDALAHALQLDEAERGHLFDLARAANTTPRTRRRPAPPTIRPAVQRILDAMTSAPAYVRNGRRDILAANRLGYALYSEMFVDPVRHNVRYHHTGVKHVRHPVVGDLHLTFEALDLPADPGLSLLTYSAEPGSTSQDALELLGSWAATLDQPDRAATMPAPDRT